MFKNLSEGYSFHGVPVVVLLLSWINGEGTLPSTFSATF
ncbi:hypothetical protein OP10G_3919 [Fimbriimonas ginsengisoli Gsoil 348]|uniref:Uncharacterized protein n=1 Tax=Fimbriimonas ginsengisoli Gsoil 348 TaxID=661478 RepID=A0A068NV88_FIMGI|nr:hypothetical protein OP10G_3919 [Fimbriimonas ginsengisoli Gsoil 348]